jgi:hypothetical protein
MLRLDIYPLKRKRCYLDSIKDITNPYEYYPSQLFPFQKRMKLTNKFIQSINQIATTTQSPADIEMLEIELTKQPLSSIERKINQDKINAILISNAIRTESTFARLFSKIYNSGKRMLYKEDPERMQID